MKKAGLVALAATALVAAPVLQPGVTSAPGMTGVCTDCHVYATPPVVTPPVVTPPVVTPPVVTPPVVTPPVVTPPVVTPPVVTPPVVTPPVVTPPVVTPPVVTPPTPPVVTPGAGDGHDSDEGDKPVVKKASHEKHHKAKTHHHAHD
jgi:hypothetical protein